MLLFLLLLFQVALFCYPFFRNLKEITFFGQVHLKALLLTLQWQLQLLQLLQQQGRRITR